MIRSFAIATPADADLVPAPDAELAADIAQLEVLQREFFTSAAVLLDANPRALPYSQRVRLPVILALLERIDARLAEVSP